MNNLIDEILKILQTHALVKTTRVVYYDETPSGKLEVKIRCSLLQNHQFQIWIHVEPQSLDYAYQLFTTVPLLRWDNSPHYSDLSSAPHHFHDERGNVHNSPLTGNIRKDLKIVLKEINEWMKEQSGEK